MFIELILFLILIVASFWVYNKLTCGICKCSKHLVGKVVIVTGGNSGIGFETAKDLADRGARVILACRNEKRGIDAQNKIIAATGNKDVHYKQLDLTSLSSVKAFVEDVIRSEERLDILINNAGVFGSEIIKTEDGLIEGMQANHFAPFLLTCLLVPLLKKSAPSRIINVSSDIYKLGEIDFDDLNMEKKAKDKAKMYADSKLCNILMATEFSRRFQGSGITCNALHPGAVSTEIQNKIDIPIFKYFFIPITQLFYKSSWEGAQTTIYLAVSPEVKDVSGVYFRDCQKASTSNIAQDVSAARKLWEKSEELVGLK